MQLGAKTSHIRQLVGFWLTIGMNDVYSLCWCSKCVLCLSWRANLWNWKKYWQIPCAFRPPVASSGNEYAIPELLNGPNPKIPAVSRSIIMDYKPATGRCLVVSCVTDLLGHNDQCCVLGCARYWSRWWLLKSPMLQSSMRLVVTAATINYHWTSFREYILFLDCGWYKIWKI